MNINYDKIINAMAIAIADNATSGADTIAQAALEALQEALPNDGGRLINRNTTDWDEDEIVGGKGALYYRQLKMLGKIKVVKGQ